jgi:MFS family permease
VVLLLQAGHLLGRYISVFSLMVIGGFAIGPAIGGAVLAFLTQRRLVGRRLVAGAISVRFLLVGDRIPRQAASRDRVKGPARQP